MAGLIGKIVFKKILGETIANKQGTEDPYFEYIPAGDTNKKQNKKLKRQKKPLPEGISAHDAKVLTKVKRRAYRLDSNINFCGIKFGWSSVIGIVPGFGDVIDFMLAMLVYRTCQQVEGGLPASVKSKMLLNMILDFAVGLIPFIGDVADALFRCNTKNAILLEKYLIEKYNPRGKGRSSRRRDDNDLEMGRPHTDYGSETPPEYSTLPPERSRIEEPRRPDRVATNKSKKSRREPDLDRGEEPEYEYRPAQPPRPRP